MDYPLIVGNWKMNLDLFEASILASRVSSGLEKIEHVEVGLCPPAVYIYPIFEHLKTKSKNLSLGIQNMMWETSGAYTGEISVDMIRGICRFAIVGHSERRKYFGETDEMVAQKTALAIKKNITPIVCVGEMEKFHLEDHFKSEVKRMESEGGILLQVKKALALVDKKDLKKIVIAYEPIWAIGTGNCASGAYAAAVCYLIKDYLSRLYSPDIAEHIRVIYGGSVGEKDIREFMLQPSISGALVGTSSLNAGEFLKICKVASEVKSGRAI